MTGSTFTRAERRRIVFISANGRVGRQRIGFVVTGGSRMTGGSRSGWEKLLLRVRGTRGTGGGTGGVVADGGTI